MTFDKPSSLSSLAKTGSVLSALVIATFLFAGSLTTVQQTVVATSISEEEQDVLDTQDEATDNLSESDRDVNGIEFTPRWGGVSTLQPNDVKVLFADCLEDEFAVSYMSMFESPDVVDYQSFPVAFPDDYMSWLAVVKNTDTTARVASIGVICADENSGDEDDVDIDISTKTTIQNIVNNFVRVENNQVINLNSIVQVHQTVTQNAIQIATITGNNNTVSQVIDQSANQILNTNTTNPVDIQQIIDQDASQQGVISSGGTLSQDIDQDADQAANVTGGAGTTVDQDIDQDADQAANVTGGGGNLAEQAIGQRGEQGADVTGGAGTTVDQGIGQGAGQAANVTGGAGTTVDQGIGQGAGQAANVTGGGFSIFDQAIGQGADQSAQVTGDED